MPLFHPVFNTLPVRRKVPRYAATKWQLLKARLFGVRVKYPSGKPMGWKHAGVIYITKDE